MAPDKNIMSTQASTNFFELMPGKIIDIELSHPNRVRIKLSLIGYSLGKYIIIKYPSELQGSNYNDVLVEGNVAICRYLLEGDRGECFAFRATIKYITKYPEKLIVLTYPKYIESRQLRMHQRIVTTLPSSIMVTNETLGQEDTIIDGIINDISNQGCGFTFRAKNEKVKVNKRDIYVCINIIGEEIKIPAKVCNSRNELGKVNVGIQFKKNDKQVISILDYLGITSNNL